jgi:hypothetical protein
VLVVDAGLSGSSVKIMLLEAESNRDIQCFNQTLTTSNDYTVPTNECFSTQWPYYHMPIVSLADNKTTSPLRDEAFLQDIAC